MLKPPLLDDALGAFDPLHPDQSPLLLATRTARQMFHRSAYRVGCDQSLLVRVGGSQSSMAHLCLMLFSAVGSAEIPFRGQGAVKDLWCTAPAECELAVSQKAQTLHDVDGVLCLKTYLDFVGAHFFFFCHFMCTTPGKQTPPSCTGAPILNPEP